MFPFWSEPRYYPAHIVNSLQMSVTRSRFNGKYGTLTRNSLHNTKGLRENQVLLDDRAAPLRERRCPYKDGGPARVNTLLIGRLLIVS